MELKRRTGNVRSGGLMVVQRLGTAVVAAIRPGCSEVSQPRPPSCLMGRDGPGSRSCDPAPVAGWLPALARELGTKKPMRVPLFIGRLLGGEASVVMMTDLRGASNANAKRELEWRPAHSSWQQGFAVA